MLKQFLTFSLGFLLISSPLFSFNKGYLDVKTAEDYIEVLEKAMSIYQSRTSHHSLILPEHEVLEKNREQVYFLALESELGLVREWAVRELIKHPSIICLPGLVKDLEKLSGSYSQNKNLNFKAIIAQKNEATWKVLEELYASTKDDPKKSYIHRSTVIALGDYGDKRAAKILLQALEDKKPLNPTLISLGKLRQKEHQKIILSYFKPEFSHRSKTAAQALSYYNTPEATQALKSLFKSAPIKSLEHAFQDFKHIEDKSFAPTFIKVIQESSNRQDIIAALDWLVRHKISKAKTDVKKLIERKYEVARLESIAALYQLGDRTYSTNALIAFLTKQNRLYGTGEKVVKTFDIFGDRALRAYTKFLKSKKGDYKLNQFATLLGVLGKKGEREALKMLKSKDKKIHVAGIHALAKSNNPKYYKQIKKAIMKTPHAAYALKYMPIEGIKICIEMSQKKGEAYRLHRQSAFIALATFKGIPDAGDHLEKSLFSAEDRDHFFIINSLSQMFYPYALDSLKQYKQQKKAGQINDKVNRMIEYYTKWTKENQK